MQMTPEFASSLSIFFETQTQMSYGLLDIY